MTDMNCGHEGSGTTFEYLINGEQVKLALCPYCFLVFLEAFMEIYNGCTKDEKKAFHWLFNEWRKAEKVKDA